MIGGPSTVDIACPAYNPPAIQTPQAAIPPPVYHTV